MGTLADLIVTTPWLEDATTPQTMATVPLRTIAPWLDTRLPPKRWQAHQEGQQAQARAWQADVEREPAQW
jgi:hypothetical protein